MSRDPLYRLKRRTNRLAADGTREKLCCGCGQWFPANAEHFYRLINRLAADGELSIDAVLPADEDVQAVYRYLIRGDGDLPS